MNDAELAERALGGQADVNVDRAYARFKNRPRAKTSAPRWLVPASAIAMAAAFACALIFTPLGSYASAFLTIFQPREFQPITVSTTDLRQLRLLTHADEIGTQRVVVKPRKSYFTSIDAAQQHIGFTVMRPTALPAGFGSVHSYFVFAPGQVAFTFSAAKAQAFARRSHKTLPAMPPDLNGTTVRLLTGYAFNAHYEIAKSRTFFELVEMQAPKVTSSGASLQTLKRYVLAMPNISPALAAQINALGDNSIPVPVNINKQHAQHVTVGGVPALAVGDNTGLGAGVMWQKNGVVYVVGGPLSMDDVMTIANGLR